MTWILCAAAFLVGGIIAILLMSCFAIAQQAEEQSDRTFYLLAGKNAAD
ncbi:MAG TPA: hypothetical protein VEM40_14855 [Nitrospirota bacterium]|nr:hypothetical protein [Nitrospirota bacterium]